MNVSVANASEVSLSQEVELSRLKVRARKYGRAPSSCPDGMRTAGRSGLWMLSSARLARAAESQAAFARWIETVAPPEAVGVLFTPQRLTIDVFRNRVAALRMLSARLHPRSFCPPRSRRSIEFVLSLEVGAAPRQSELGRLHGHILIWNLNAIQLADLGKCWRLLNGLTDVSEPRLEAYRRQRGAVGYCLKTLHTDADLITLSPKLKDIFRRSQAEGRQVEPTDGGANAPL